MVLQEPAADVRGALLHVPWLHLHCLCFAVCRFGGSRILRYARRRGQGGVELGRGHCIMYFYLDTRNQYFFCTF